ncbi:hypothetical protein [Micromonospora sp. NPDC048839]|uniref:hypothetical protein n=1 Tax=Micromonospora sp. NPDC048839 TaxID=3155641 RepID=UPI0034051007
MALAPQACGHGAIGDSPPGGSTYEEAPAVMIDGSKIIGHGSGTTEAVKGCHQCQATAEFAQASMAIRPVADVPHTP